MRDDFAEYTKCEPCNKALIYCDCNCPYCGKRDKCNCEMMQLSITS